MLKHYLVLFTRNFKRHKSTFFINLAGLSTGIACTLLIYLWVMDEQRVDKFHENDDRLYQAMKHEKQPNGIETDEPTPGLLAQALKAEMPEVENASAIISKWFSNKGILSAGETRLKASEMYVDKEYFKLFSYPVLSGNRNNLLPDKNSMAISDELAMKLFGRTDNVVGQRVDWAQGEFTGPYMITGVFKKPPHNSTMQFDCVFQYDLFMEKNPNWLKWGNSSSLTYLLLKKGTDIQRFNDKIAGFINAKHAETRTTLFVRKYSDQYLYGHYENGKSAGGRIAYIKLFSVIAIFILVIACINFMNLSTAKASGRLKEVGIKKAVGARRINLVLQYLSESILMAALSLVIAILLVNLFLPQFNSLTGKQLVLQFDSTILLTLAAVTVVTGILSGSYPALYLSGFKPISILKGKLKLSPGESLARKGLVVFQFTISVILIIAVLVIYRQMEFIQTKNLGYNRDNVLHFDTQEDSEAFMHEINAMPGVVNATRFHHNLTGEHGSAWGFSWDDQLPGGRDIEFVNLEVGYDFVETFGMQLVAGKSFSRDFAPETQIILNEAAIAAMGLKDPVGKTFHIWGKDRKIVGIVKNFHYTSLYEKIRPNFLLLVPFRPDVNKIMVRIKSGEEKKVIEQLEKAYRTHNPGLAFNYRFVDEDYQALYASEKRVSVLSRYFAGIAIIISCLGLFGLAAFTAEKRTREIGIRKVLGATVQNITLLLTKEFVLLVLLANLIAWPVAWFFMQHWLQDFAYKINIGMGMFALATLAALIITVITVSFQAVKAALTNPVKSLRTE